MLYVTQYGWKAEISNLQNDKPQSWNVTQFIQMGIYFTRDGHS